MVVYERGEHLRLEEPGEEGEVRLLLVGEERSLVEVLQREISGISGKVQIMYFTVANQCPRLHGLPLLRRHGGEVGVGGHDHKVLEREEHVREAVAEHLVTKTVTVYFNGHSNHKKVSLSLIHM